MMRTGRLLFASLLAATALAGAASAQERAVSGHFELNAVEFYKVQVDADDPYHLAVLTRQVGRNESTGETAFMPDAEVAVTNASDEKGATFVQHGYAEFRSADGTALFEFTGEGTSQIDGEKVTFAGEGTWELTKATGAHEGETGSGTLTFEGSPETSVVHWQGSLQ